MPDPSDATVRDLAGRILARPEYADAAGAHSKVENWLAHLLDRLLQWLASLDLIRGSSPFTYWLIVITIAAICAGLIAHVTWSIWRAMTAPEPALPLTASRSALPDFAREADSLAAEGRYLDAAHRLMLASFRTLGEKSIIELRPDRPNQWIRAAVRDSSLAGGLAAEIDLLVERTERRWFGDRADDSEVYQRWRTAYQQLSGQPR